MVTQEAWAETPFITVREVNNSLIHRVPDKMFPNIAPHGFRFLMCNLQR